MSDLEDDVLKILREHEEAVHAARISGEAEVWGALVAGLGDYVRKNGFSTVVLGMSGGIDSGLVAYLVAHFNPPGS